MSSGSKVRITALGLIVASLAAAQQAGERPRVVIGGIRVLPPAPPEPQPGDVFEIEDGDIIIGSLNREGQPERHRIRRPNKVEPGIEAEVSLADGGLLRYSYTIHNGVNARQKLEYFRIETPRPDLIRNPSPASGWRNSGPTPIEPRRGYNWASAEMGNGLPPGRSAGPFRLKSPLLPGLTQAWFDGYLTDEEMRVDKRSWVLSPWLQKKLDEEWTSEKDGVFALTIGPKFTV